MKKLIFLLIIVVISFTACNLYDDEKSIVVTYDGTFYLSILNTCFNGDSHALFTWGKGKGVWEESELEMKVGTLDELEVEGIKALGSAFPDGGNLTVKIKEGEDVVAKGTAPHGTQRVTIFYDF